MSDTASISLLTKLVPTWPDGYEPPALREAMQKAKELTPEQKAEREKRAQKLVAEKTAKCHVLETNAGAWLRSFRLWWNGCDKIQTPVTSTLPASQPAVVNVVSDYDPPAYVRER